MNPLKLSQNPEQVKNNFQRKYDVEIKAMFWNGCCSYLSLVKPQFKKNINSRIINNIGVQKIKLHFQMLPLQSYQILYVEH